jgi:DNA-binding response OmpR family regulator
MSQSKGTLLIVDDEAEIREIIEVNVAALGFTVLEAGDGEQALEILKEHQVDVVVSDLMMPRMSGLTLLTDMRDLGYMQPFIFVTAFPSQDSTIQALRLGAFDYVEKPFDSEELKMLILEAVRVSQEMGRLGIKGAPTKGKIPAGDSQAVADIQRLRTLRYSDERSVAQVSGAAREKLLEMFVSEAMPQILFCEAAIKGLQNPEERSFELGYLFRVMQAVRSAAESIGATHIAELASTAERFYTALRVRQRSVNDETIDLATRVNNLLRDLVDNISQARELDASQKAVLAEIRGTASSLEGSSKAS